MDAHQYGATAPTDETLTKRHPEKGRSRLSNSLFRLPGLNGNLRPGRRYRDVIKAAMADMGTTEDKLSESERETLRTLGLLTIRLDALQERAGEDASELDELGIVRLANTLARLRKHLGIGPRRRTTLTPADPIAIAARHQGGA
jgi:hypothetical protein